MLINFVHMFNQVFGVHMRKKPGLVDLPTLRTRMALLTEEYLEILEAAGAPYDHIVRARGELEVCVNNLDLSCFNLPAFVDGHGDLDYISAGTMLVHGVDMRPVHNVIHRANMAKRQPDGTIKRRADGKILKPEGWRGPDIEGVLRAQGWTP